jgi:hypothetical protein
MSVHPTMDFRLHRPTVQWRMDALELFLPRYEKVHAQVAICLLEGLSDRQLRYIPVQGLKSIAWLIWHTTRVEDLVVNRFVAHCSQLFHEQSWGERLRVSEPGIGVGMNCVDVDALSADIDLTALRAYRAAVEARTRAVMLRLRPPDLDEIVDAAYIGWLLAADDALSDGGRHELDEWDSNTKGAYLADMALTHHWQHFGEALTIRTLVLDVARATRHAS